MAPAHLDGTVTLRWSAASDNTGVRGYDVYRDGTRVGSATGTTYADGGLRPSTAYAYVAVAKDAQGNESPRSAVVRVTTGAACTNPVCEVREVYRDTDIPWGLVTLPDGTVLYNRRDAHDIARLSPVTGVRTLIGSVPAWRAPTARAG